MNDTLLTYDYGRGFEGHRRLKPRLWDVDYCLLRGIQLWINKTSHQYAKPHMSIIDMGCGAKPYRPLFPGECSYIGVDVCNNPYADIISQSGQSIQLPSQSADLIISTQVVYLIKDYDFYLSECRRLLKPSGIMLITSHGTWTYHPASGGDYYRFTQDGLKHILESNGFELSTCEPIVGTLSTGLHLRQLVINSWLRHLRLSYVANIVNIFINLRILFEDTLCPLGSRMASPVIWACVAKARI